MNGSLIAVTDEDRRNGWAEIPIQTHGGRRDFVRVHALAPKDLVQVAHLSPAEVANQLAALAIREPVEFVAELDGGSILRIAATLAALLHGEAEANQLADHCMEAAFNRMRTGSDGTLAETNQ